MSFAPREYRRHILAEADYLVAHSRELTPETFQADETLRRAFVRSLEIIGEQNAPVIGRYGVRHLGLFGSGARGTAREGSDLDFVVEFETKSFDSYMDLKA